MFFLYLLFSLSQASYSSSLLQCQSLTLVESIPDGVTFPSSSIANPSTTSVLNKLINITTISLDIAQFYFSLRADPPPGDGSDFDGRDLWRRLQLWGNNGSSLRIVHNVPNQLFPDNDSEDLAKSSERVKLRYLDFTKLIGRGIIHTKLWIGDNKHFYLGSANTDWRSLRQVKEMGLFGINCPAIGKDLQKMFDIYWYLSDNPVPTHFPSHLDTEYNMNNPMKLVVKEDNSDMDIFLVSSPPPFCTKSRTNDIDGLLNVLNSALQFIYIEVMDYFPAIIYSYPEQYWPVIDDALRRAVFDRGVEVRLLVSPMPHNLTRSDEYNYLASLAALDGSGKHGQLRCAVKLFVVPSYTPEQEKLKYARVNHAKFVVTDKHAYLSTSNWSGDYFTSTGGISSVMRCYTSRRGVCQGLLDVFNRDWNSHYTKPLKPWGESNYVV